jgi:hypothetical protein
MTLVGKILTFFVLILSLGVGALIAFDYATRTRWAVEYDKLYKDYTVVQASLATRDAEAKKATSDAAAEVAQLKLALKKTQDDLVAQQNLVGKLNNDMLAEKSKNVKAESISSGSLVESQKHQASEKQMRETLQDVMKKNADLIEEANKARDDKVAATIAANSYKDKNERLEAQLRLLAEDNARLKANPTGGTVAKGAKNPPPENVEGLIELAEGGSVQLTIGSDAGLAEGHTLEVFRLSPNPKYLGTIKITRVTAQKAVAQPVGKMTDTLKPGDHVAARLGS